MRYATKLWMSNYCQKLAQTHTHTQPLYGPFSGTTRVSRCQKKSSGLYGARGDMRGRHTDNPNGHHSIRTNQRPTSLIPHFYIGRPSCRNPSSSQFILAWDRHWICWLAYPVQQWQQYISIQDGPKSHSHSGSFQTTQYMYNRKKTENFLKIPASKTLNSNKQNTNFPK